MMKPETLNREQNSVEISWESRDFEVSTPNGNWILQLCDDTKKWRTIYCGKKRRFQIKNLVPCTGYDARLRLENSWLSFKIATADAPYLMMHMTRAVRFGKTALLRKIANARPRLLETENKDNKTPLVEAVEKGDLGLVNLLINLGTNVNGCLLNVQRTPLMVATYLGHLQVASLLIDKGCDVNSKDINGLNVLHYAVDSGNVENVDFALKVGLHVDCKDRAGWTPLLRAVILGVDEKIISLLLEKGASKVIKDNCGFDFGKHRQLCSGQ